MTPEERADTIVSMHGERYQTCGLDCLRSEIVEEITAAVAAEREAFAGLIERHFGCGVYRNCQAPYSDPSLSCLTNIIGALSVRTA